MKLVFITTCSKNKEGGGREHGDWPDATLADSDLLKDRASLFDEIRSSDPQMLRGAVKGPDFGGDASAGSYLQAYSRYLHGSFMISLKDELEKQEEQLDSWLKSNQLFFISGLYGLVNAMEPIQNYDVSMTNIATEHWIDNRLHLTDALIQKLPDDAMLLDCCGNRHYSDLINWELIERRSNATVRHAVEPEQQRDGGQVRAEVGKNAAFNISKSIQALMEEKYFDGANASIKFVSNPDFARMPKSRNTVVYDGADLLLPKLELFVTDRLKKSLGNTWEEQVKKKVSRRKAFGDRIVWDLLYLLRVIGEFWGDVFESKLESGLPIIKILPIVKELREVRNEYSHPESRKGFSPDDAARALDSMCRLADAIGAKDETAELRKMRDSILREILC